MSIQQKDIFICHASEDKPSVVRPLYECLESGGFQIWYDEAEINWGDSISERVNWGLIHSRYVVVVLSKSFLNKKWPNREFNSVVNSESSSGIVKVLPLLVGDDEEVKTIVETYPLINDKKYLRWSNNQAEIVEELLKIFPERNLYVEKKIEIKRIYQKISTHKILYGSDIKNKFQVIEGLLTGEKGILVKPPEEICGIPFDKALDALYEINKGSSLIYRYIDKAIFNKFEFKFSGNQKLFLEMPALFEDSMIIQTHLQALVNEADINPEGLIVLIPEIVLTRNIDVASHMIDSLGSVGIKSGISRFGSGYSSLSYLKSLELSHLFVDHSFLSDFREGSADFDIVQTICLLAKSLKIPVCIEQIENEEQKELLKKMGCDLVSEAFESKRYNSDVF